MDISNEPIVVNYQKKPTECRCCGRAFDNDESDYGAVKQFEITVSGFFEWTDWGDEERFKDQVSFYEGELLYEDELEPTVEEYVYSTISFYACNSEDILKIEQDEIKKVYEAVKGEVIRLLS